MVIHRDDKHASSVESESHLISWNGVKVDRFDARLTIDDMSRLTKKGGPDTFNKETVSTDDLDYERFRDMDDDSDGDSSDGEEVKKPAVFGPTYDTKVSTSPLKTEPDAISQPKAALFHPSFSVPPHLVLPNTLAEHKAIAATAAFVRIRGAQAEILFKVKQSNNQKFGFLVLDNPLNAYYEYLRDTGLEHDETADPARATPSTSSTSAPAPVLVKARAGPPGMAAPPGMKLPTKAPATIFLPKGPPALPPPKVVTMIDNIAPFVVKNGAAFEEMVREKDPDGSSFLRPEDEHHAYYQYRIAREKYTQKMEQKTPQIPTAALEVATVAAPEALPVEIEPEEPKRSESAEKEKRREDALESERARQRILSRMPKRLRSRSRSKSRSESKSKKKKDKSRDRDKGRDRDNDKDRDKSRDRDKGRDREKDSKHRDSERKRDKSRDREKKREKGSNRSKSRDRDGEWNLKRSRDKGKERSRSRDRGGEEKRKRSRSPKSRSPKVDKTPSSDAASHPWKEAIDAASGNTYYYNEDTRETTWKKPY
jgi:hypothetical protein